MSPGSTTRYSPVLQSARGGYCRDLAAVPLISAAAPAIGICGSYGGLNAGDEAILTATIAQLREHVPDALITTFSRNPDHTRTHHDVHNVLPQRDTIRADLAAELEKLDLLLLGGGGLLYDREAGSYLNVARLAQSLGTPTATYAIGAGPLERESERREVAQVLNAMHRITVRDVRTKALLEQIGVEQDVRVTADPAVLLAPEPFSPERLHREGIGTGRSIVGMSLREPGGAAEDLEAGVYHGLLASAADFIVSRFDADVVFVPMERTDIREAHRVVAEMGLAERAFVLKKEYTPGELLGLMRLLDMAVGMRLHFILFAALTGVAVQALPYASKVDALLEQLGLSAPGPIQREHTGVLLAAIDRLWDTRADQVANLAQRVPEMKRRARETAPLVLELVSQPQPPLAAA
jgi:polysaccharide pyruvyl transferase CsaB